MSSSHWQEVLLEGLVTVFPTWSDGISMLRVLSARHIIFLCLWRGGMVQCFFCLPVKKDKFILIYSGYTETFHLNHIGRHMKHISEKPGILMYIHKRAFSVNFVHCFAWKQKLLSQ